MPEDFYKTSAALPGKLFDWEKAKAGDPVVDTYGKPVTQLTKFDTTDSRPYRGVKDGYIYAFGERDLFMAPVKKTAELYVNLYKQGDGLEGYGYDKKESADQYGSLSIRLGKKAHKVTIEYEE